MKKKILYIIVFIAIFLIVIVKFFNNSSNKYFDDFLFLKLFSKGYQNYEKSTEQISEYKMDIKNNEIEIKEIEIKEKLEPGKSGDFNIILNNKYKSKCKFQIKDITEKPTNLKFKVFFSNNDIVEVDSLEKISGKIEEISSRTQNLKIKVHWYWPFEGGEDDYNLKDTIDSKKIKQYKFEMHAICQE